MSGSSNESLRRPRRRGTDGFGRSAWAPQLGGAALHAAARLGRRVVVPSVILAELYRGPRHNQLVDACLSRETGIQVRDTDRPLARLVGGVLAAAQAGSEHLADAHVIAAAVELGGGLAVTKNADDLGRLAAAYRNVTVIGLP